MRAFKGGGWNHGNSNVKFCSNIRQIVKTRMIVRTCVLHSLSRGYSLCEACRGRNTQSVQNSVRNQQGLTTIFDCDVTAADSIRLALSALVDTPVPPLCAGSVLPRANSLRNELLQCIAGFNV